MRVLPIIAAGAVLAAARLATAGGTGAIVAIDGGGAVADEPAQRAVIARAIIKAIADSRAGAHAGDLDDDAVATARAAVAAGAVPVATLQRLRRVREEIDEGWRAYLRVEVALARSRLAVARTEAEAIVALPGGAEIYADASLRLGAVLEHLGRQDEARAAIALALALDPDRPISPAEFAPGVIDAVAAVRAAPVAKRRVQLASRPPGALISVDRVDLGAAPLDADLTRGQHVIIARARQHHAAALAVAIDDATSTLELALDDDPLAARLDGGARLGLDAAGAQELVDATLQFADLDEVVLVTATQRAGGPALLVQRCAGAPARCTAVAEVGYGAADGLAAAASTAWATVSGGALRGVPLVFGDRSGGGGAGEHRCGVCRDPWVLGGVGAAIVGTIVLIVVESASKPPPNVGIDPNQFGRR